MLSETRLAEIRDRAAWTCRERGADIDALLAHVDHLTAENAPADVDPPVEFKAGDRVSFAYCGDRITCTLVDGHRGLMSDTPDKDGYRPRVMEESGGLAPFITDVRQITDAEADVAHGPTQVAPGVWECIIDATSSPSTLTVTVSADGHLLTSIIAASPHCKES